MLTLTLMDRTKWNLTEVILGVLRRRTRKVSAYWMLPPMDNRTWHDRFTDRELKNISTVRSNNVAAGYLVEQLTLGSC
jgi:hypothetical protein